MEQEIITFIFASSKPAEFTEQIYDNRNILQRTNGVVIHDMKIFNSIFDLAASDFKFRIIIHAGIPDNESEIIGASGLNFLGDIRAMPGFENIDIPFVSRKKGIFLDLNTKQQTLSKEIDGYQCFYTPMANDPKHINTFVSKLPVYTKGELLGTVVEVPGLKKGLDFAVLTALYKDEFQIYKEHCLTAPDTIVGNSYNAQFAIKADRVIGDYDKPFALIHQEQMGLVDAAIYSTQIIDKIDPRFLLMGGVCGGSKSKTELYDIIIPTIIYDYGTGKLIDARIKPLDPDSIPKIPFSFSYQGEKNSIAGNFQSKEFKSNSEKLLTTYLLNRKIEIIQNMKELMPESLKDSFPPNFNIHIDEFACGPWVVKTNGFLDDFLLNEFSAQIKGLEMESYSVNRAGNIAQKYGRYSLVVKSVMDYTESNKTDGPGGSTKRFASLVSLICIRALMPILLEFKDPKLDT